MKNYIPVLKTDATIKNSNVGHGRALFKKPHITTINPTIDQLQSNLKRQFNLNSTHSGLTTDIRWTDIESKQITTGKHFDVLIPIICRGDLLESAH